MVVLEIVAMIIILALIIVSQILKYIREKKKEENKISDKIDAFFDKHYKKIWLFFILILLITVVYKFGSYPNYVGADEAGMAYDAYSVANYGVDRYLNSFPLYLQNFGGGQSVLCMYISVFFIKIFGANIITYRIPALLIYILGVIASYFFVKDSKNKKTALLFTFLIITCPWNIVNARQALDCNLYGGMLMINLFLMNRAKKNYQYIIASISVGITLYTYCLSWITMPIFLVAWTAYMIYIKKIKLKQLVIFAIPIIILAFPLIYFLLLNYGIVKNSNLGIFSLPILNDFRNEQISVLNIFKYTARNLKTIFLDQNTIYIPYIPLFIFGFVVAIIRTIKDIENKKYSINTVITIAFTTIFCGLMLVAIPTPNKANALYIPILYFVAIALEYVFKNSKELLLASIAIIIIIFVSFEYNYYTSNNIGNTENVGSILFLNWYNDKTFTEVISKFEKDDNIKNAQKYILPYRAQPYIYQILHEKISPYEFNEISERKMHDGWEEITKVGTYNYYAYVEDKEEFAKKDFTKEDCIIIISEQFASAADEYKKHYKEFTYKDLHIYVNFDSKLDIEKVLNN